MTAPARSYTVTEFEASPGPALRHARAGTEVEITSRGEPVAFLTGAEGDPILPGGPLPPLPVPVRLRRLHPTSDEILSEDRR